MSFQKITKDSVNSISSALNFFQVPCTNTTVSSSATREFLTLNPLTDKPYHFKIHASTSFIDLSKCYILTEMRIKKENAAGNLVNIVDADNIAPINLIGSTFIKNLKISLNGRETYDSNSLYGYKSYLSSELTYPQTVKDSYLNSAGYYMDDVDQNLVTNKGFLARKELFKNSGTVQLMSRIDADLFNTELYLVNNIEIDIEILPHDDKFLLQAPGNAGATRYHLEIVSCKLYCKMLELHDGLALDISKALEKTPAQYPVRKSSMKTIFISEGRYELNANLFSDQVPRRLILGLVNNGAYVGDYEQSPFNFEPFNLREISVTTNGQNYPSVNYNLNFHNNQFVRAYHDLNESIGLSNSLDSNGISMAKYKTGWCLYGFNLTTAQEDSGCFDLLKSGSTNIGIRFSAPVRAGGLVLIVMGEFDSIILLDHNRTISSDITI